MKKRKPDLSEMERRLDEALSKETPQSLRRWLKEQRKDNRNMQSKLEGKKSVYPLITLDDNNIIELGLNKRELFSSMAMQSLINTGYFSTTNEGAAVMSQLAVKCADALLEELNKKQV